MKLDVRHAGFGRRRALNHWTAPSGSFSQGSLAARRLGAIGPPVVLLHGMVGSNTFWGGEFDAVATAGRLVAVDLLGFGDSPKPVSGYRARDHAEAVALCLRELGVDEPAVMMGHSMGSLVAIAVARYHPELVSRIVAIAPPVYSSRADATRHIRAMGIQERLMALGPASQWMCRWMCANRALATRLAPFVAPSLPRPIAHAAVKHTWPSYSQSLEELILSCDARGWLVETTKPVQLIAALDDPVPELPLLTRLCAENRLLSLDLWPRGGHLLPLTQPAQCLAAIFDALDRLPMPVPTADSSRHSLAASVA